MKSRDSLQGKQQKTKAGSASSQRSPSVVLVVGQSEHKLSVFSQVFLLSASQAFILQKYVACTKNYCVRTRPSNSTYNLDAFQNILLINQSWFGSRGIFHLPTSLTPSHIHFMQFFRFSNVTCKIQNCFVLQTIC